MQCCYVKFWTTLPTCAMSSVKEDKKMAKKKSVTPANKAKSGKIEKVLLLVAFVVVVWSLIASIFKSVAPGVWFWIALVFLAIRWIVLGGFLGKSYTYFVKKLFKPLGEKIKKWRENLDSDDDDDSGDDDDDDDSDDALPEHLEMVTDVNAEGKPVSVIALKKAYCPADLVPTLTYVKSADGKHEVPMTVLRKPLKPADIPADKKINALNIAVPKAPAKVKCSTAGCTGEGQPGKHCPECGAKFVAAAPKEVKCSKPGCTGKGQPGKFCPECGTKLS